MATDLVAKLRPPRVTSFPSDIFACSLPMYFTEYAATSPQAASARGRNSLMVSSWTSLFMPCCEILERFCACMADTACADVEHTLCGWAQGVWLCRLFVTSSPRRRLMAYSNIADCCRSVATGDLSSRALDCEKEYRGEALRCKRGGPSSNALLLVP